MPFSKQEKLTKFRRIEIEEVKKGMATTSRGWQSTSDWGRSETYTRRDDVLPTTSTSEETYYMVDVGKSNDVFDIDPPREPSADGAKVELFSKLKLIPTEPKDYEEGSDDDEEHLRFKTYSSLAYMHNVYISADDALEFLDLPHSRRGHTSSLLDSGDLEVGKEFCSKDGFLGALKQYSIKNGINYYVAKSKSEKFEAECAV
ncbi:hypothetical protein J1N35_043323 [Gossypium stocksii]|uniref:Uncharacterized protein n=1 Tax=Gossypium stocksii TaxID=47602 RepID=A0A9D3U7B9_9ROSI|nr:hypothetical protein J1N35_043323 [Gossypium stocksii]